MESIFREKHVSYFVHLLRSVKYDEHPKEVKCSNYKETGIQVFSFSKQALCQEEIIDDTTEINQRNKKRKKKLNEDEPSKSEMIQAAVIEGERILSQIDTKMWQNRRKGKVFKYKKLKNGSLMEQV